MVQDARPDADGRAEGARPRRPRTRPGGPGRRAPLRACGPAAAGRRPVPPLRPTHPRESGPSPPPWVRNSAPAPQCSPGRAAHGPGRRAAGRCSGRPRADLPRCSRARSEDWAPIAPSSARRSSGRSPCSLCGRRSRTGSTGRRCAPPASIWRRSARWPIGGGTSRCAGHDRWSFVRRGRR